MLRASAATRSLYRFVPGELSFLQRIAGVFWRMRAISFSHYVKELLGCDSMIFHSRSAMGSGSI